MGRLAVIVLLLGTAACATLQKTPPGPLYQPGWQVGVRRPAAPGPVVVAGRIVDAAGSISGRIVDAATGEPLRNATAIATSPALQGPKYELTDDAGQFTLTGLPDGQYDLLAIYGDAKLRATGVPVDAGGDRWVSVRLDLSTVELFKLGPCGPPAIDAGSTEQKTVIDWRTLKNLPW